MVRIVVAKAVAASVVVNLVNCAFVGRILRWGLVGGGGTGGFGGGEVVEEDEERSAEGEKIAAM